MLFPSHRTQSREKSKTKIRNKKGYENATLSQQSSTTLEISNLDVPFIYADNFIIYGTLFSPQKRKIFISFFCKFTKFRKTQKVCIIITIEKDSWGTEREIGNLLSNKKNINV